MQVDTIKTALEGMTLAAHLAYHHRLDQVMDALVVSLAKWTVLLDPHAPRPSVAFGDNPKARLATEAIFLLANRCACSFS